MNNATPYSELSDSELIHCLQNTNWNLRKEDFERIANELKSRNLQKFISIYQPNSIPNASINSIKSSSSYRISIIKSTNTLFPPIFQTLIECNNCPEALNSIKKFVYHEETLLQRLSMLGKYPFGQFRINGIIYESSVVGVVRGKYPVVVLVSNELENGILDVRSKLNEKTQYIGECVLMLIAISIFTYLQWEKIGLQTLFVPAVMLVAIFGYPTLRVYSIHKKIIQLLFEEAHSTSFDSKTNQFDLTKRMPT